MPELPEVETIRRGLQRWATGKTVARVRVWRPDMVRGSVPRLRRALCGLTLHGIGRRGKVLLLDFGPQVLLVHLRMTGVLLCHNGNEPLPSHPRIILEFTDGCRVVFQDVRALGTVELVDKDRLDDARSLAGIGPDVLDGGLDAEALRASFAGHTRDIKTHLLDQRHFAGIGNIYACEALFRARIRPTRRCSRLTRAETQRLARSIRAVLQDAIRHGGTTVSDYRGPDGLAGDYAHHLMVYGREGRRCRRRGCGGEVRRMVQAGRSTFCCPRCQR
jgi:formamidopyrimidine-DNA glycosylase